MQQQPLVNQGLHIIEASWWNADTPHSLELFWMSDEVEAEIPTWQQKTLTKYRHPCPRRMNISYTYEVLIKKLPKVITLRQTKQFNESYIRGVHEH